MRYSDLLRTLLSTNNHYAPPLITLKRRKNNASAQDNNTTVINEHYEQYQISSLLKPNPLKCDVVVKEVKRGFEIASPVL